MDRNDGMARRRIRIEGRVQGIGYRAWVAARAKEAGVEGWVRNRRDGAVEAAFEGEGALIDGLVERCCQGPRTAAVAGIEDLADDGAALGPGFDVRSTV